MHYLRKTNNAHYRRDLFLLAEKPQHCRPCAACYVNGVKFVCSARDELAATQSNGVMVEGVDSVTYYGVVDCIYQLTYGDGMNVVLFKCTWYNNDMEKRSVTNYLDRGLLSLDTSQTWYAEDPFILASMARQVFYLADPLHGDGWKVVQHVSHRGIYSDSMLHTQNEFELSAEVEEQPNEPAQDDGASILPPITEDFVVDINGHDMTHVGEYESVRFSEIDLAAYDLSVNDKVLPEVVAEWPDRDSSSSPTREETDYYSSDVE